jgi:DENN domain-containing protein 3
VDPSSLKLLGLTDNRRKKEVLLKYRNSKEFGFNLENYNFELLLQTLRPEKIIQLVTCLLLERKVVLIKQQIGDIALIMQALIALMNPFTWHFTIITYLTHDMVDFLEAPVPYLIGVSTKTWEMLGQVKEYPEDIIIFDLES